MTMKTTFEDRLLAELQGEIERRETDSSVPAAPRRVFTGRRLALAAAACAVAALAVVLVPGSPADSPAYAVEHNGDGTVTLTLKDLEPTLESQHELAERLRPSGIHVDIQNLDARHVCRQPRGEQLPEGKPVHPGEAWRITLRPGDSVAFENHETTRGKAWAVAFYAVEGKIEPCVRTETTKDFMEVTTSPSSVGR
ncbi:hypothetical protein [Streptomyces sp. NPDC051001]|uniref:hypothetical protein n=1 Tax=Streptomyces sp. NPDC051001 TaxID=3155795 RepID=UPI003424D772